MPLPLFGTSKATIEAASPVSIHGDVYYDLSLRLDGETAAQMARVAQHLFARPPRAGDRADVTFLMGQVNEVRFT